MCALAKRGTILFLLLCWCGGSAFWGQPPPEVPMTQIPHIAPFAWDRQVADRFAGLAEFSIRLLQWNGTDRPAVIKAQRWLKSELYKADGAGWRRQDSDPGRGRPHGQRRLLVAGESPTG